jgi:hypothetical protein
MPWYLFLSILYTYSGYRCNHTGLAQATQAVQSVRPVENTVHDQRKREDSIPYEGQSEDAVKYTETVI